jgi:hypothetical protein
MYVQRVRGVAEGRHTESEQPADRSSSELSQAATPGTDDRWMVAQDSSGTFELPALYRKPVRVTQERVESESMMVAYDQLISAALAEDGASG